MLFEHVAVGFVTPPGEAVELELALHPGAPGVTEIIDGGKRLNPSTDAVKQHLLIAYQQQVRAQQACFFCAFNECAFNEIGIGGGRGVGEPVKPPRPCGDGCQHGPLVVGQA